MRFVSSELLTTLCHLHDLGESGGVRGDDTMTLHSSSKNSSFKGTLRTMLCNGVWTGSAGAKHLQNARGFPLCQHCQNGIVETLRHIWWERQKWTHTHDVKFRLTLRTLSWTVT